MKFLEDILEYFDEEAVDEGLDTDLGEGELSFLDHDLASDSEAIEKIQKAYGLDAEGAEEFLEITQSIQHSIGDELADIETLHNIDDYVQTFNAEPERLVGLVNNVKGIYGEHQVIEALKEQYPENYTILRDYATNAKDVDLKVFDDSGNLVDKIQVKVTNDPDYILNTRSNLPDDIKIITTDEVIEDIISRTGELPEGVESIGLSCDEITADVTRSINILNQTEPEFNLLIHDPVISEQLSYGAINPFEEEKLFGGAMRPDQRFNSPQRWVYMGQTDVIDISGTEEFDVKWSPEQFVGVGDPLAEAEFFKPQETSVSCAVATQRNIIESLTGEALEEQELIKFASEKGFFNVEAGTTSQHLSAILKDKGFDCTDYTSGTISMIEDALSDGDKVMIGVDGSELSNPLRSLITNSIVEQPDMLHCLQVTGIDYSDPSDIKVILSDPGDIDGAMKAVTLDDFKAAWADSDNRLTLISKKA